MYFLMYLPSKRERKRMANLLSGSRRTTRSITASGIYGVVTDVSKETNKVTLRIDESTGAKIRVELTSIVRVLGDEPAADPVEVNLVRHEPKRIVAIGGGFVWPPTVRNK